MHVFSIGLDHRIDNCLEIAPTAELMAFVSPITSMTFEMVLFMSYMHHYICNLPVSPKIPIDLKHGGGMQLATDVVDGMLNLNLRQSSRELTQNL